MQDKTTTCQKEEFGKRWFYKIKICCTTQCYLVLSSSYSACLHGPIQTTKIQNKETNQ